MPTDIDKIASLLDGDVPPQSKPEETEVDAEVESSEEGDENEESEEGAEDEEGEEGSEDKQGPSFMPDLLSGREETPPSVKHKKSMIETGTAISVVSILKQELHKIGCTLKDYRIEFTINGVDINNIKIGTNNVEELRGKLGDLDAEEKARIASKITTLALVAVNEPFKERIKQDLGLNISLFEYDNADMGAASLGVPDEPEMDPIQGIADTIPDMGMPPAEEPAAPAPEEPAMPVEPSMEQPPGASPADMGTPPPVTPDQALGAPIAPPATPAPAAPPAV